MTYLNSTWLQPQHEERLAGRMLRAAIYTGISYNTEYKQNCYKISKVN